MDIQTQPVVLFGLMILLSHTHLYKFPHAPQFDMLGYTFSQYHDMFLAI